MSFAATYGTYRMSVSMTGMLTCCMVGDPTSGAGKIGPVPLSPIMVSFLTFFFKYAFSLCGFLDWDHFPLWILFNWCMKKYRGTITLLISLLISTSINLWYVYCRLTIIAIGTLDGELQCCLFCPITRVAQIYNGFHVEPIWVIPITSRLTPNILAITIVRYITTVHEGSGLRSPKSVWSVPIGRTERVSTSSGKTRR